MREGATHGRNLPKESDVTAGRQYRRVAVERCISRYRPACFSTRPRLSPWSRNSSDKIFRGPILSYEGDCFQGVSEAYRE